MFSVHDDTLLQRTKAVLRRVTLHIFLVLLSSSRHGALSCANYFNVLRHVFPCNIRELKHRRF